MNSTDLISPKKVKKFIEEHLKLFCHINRSGKNRHNKNKSPLDQGSILN